MIAIEKNVTIPGPGEGRRKYPWDGMGIGDSFKINVPTTEKKTPTWRALRSAADAAARVRGWAFSVRCVDGGVRVWRVK